MNEELKVIISAEVSKLKQGVNEAQQAISGFTSKSKIGLKQFEDGISKADKAVKKGAVAIGAAVGASATAIYGLANKTADTADRIDKLSQKIGISKQGFQEWDYVCSQSGVDVEIFQNGMKTLVNQMDAAAGGSKTATAAFNALGISWTDNTGALKSQETMLNETISALANMEDGSERAKIATELFGRAGTELAPILNSGVAGIDELKDRCHELGLVMDDSAISAGVKLGDTIADVKSSLGAVGRQIGEQLMPIIQEIADKILEHLPQIQEAVAALMEKVSSIINFIIEHWDFIKGIAIALGTVAAAIMGVNAALKAYHAVMGLVHIITSPTTLIIAAIVAAIAGLIAIIVLCVKHWDEIKEAVINCWNKIKETTKAAVDAVVGFFKNLWKNITETVGNIVQSVKDKFEEIKTNMEQKIENAKESVVNVFTSIKENIKEKLDDAKESALSIFDGIRDGIQEKIDNAKEFVHNAIENIKGFFDFDWELPKIKLPHFEITGSFSLNPPSIPHFNVSWYANGGVFDNPTLFGYGNGSIGGLGEAGAEAIVPLEKNTKWLDKIAEKLQGNTAPVYLVVDDKVFGEVAVSTINGITRRNGQVPLQLV